MILRPILRFGEQTHRPPLAGSGSLFKLHMADVQRMRAIIKD